MEELRKKTIAALTKQVELLSKDGVSLASVESANQSIAALTILLHELYAQRQLQPLMAE
ncbi:hypothetical protein [Oscillibacter sp.]|uniref:hypothetical protein n=1 Tax=Oscillibacter sp. TaxID=1945593 RepID=UPI00289F6E42|nr:hypothetical protein [Oscillibacter sp.]